jgi:hypothetical protein
VQSPAGRIRRGFSRIGIAFATVFALIAAAVGLYNGVSEWETISMMAVVAVVIWFVFFSLGWVISGFARD